MCRDVRKASRGLHSPPWPGWACGLAALRGAGAGRGPADDGAGGPAQPSAGRGRDQNRFVLPRLAPCLVSPWGRRLPPHLRPTAHPPRRPGSPSQRCSAPGMWGRWVTPVWREQTSHSPPPSSPGDEGADTTLLVGSMPLLWSWVRAGPLGARGAGGEQGVWGGSAFGGATVGCCGAGARLRRSPRRRCCRPR